MATTDHEPSKPTGRRYKANAGTCDKCGMATTWMVRFTNPVTGKQVPAHLTDDGTLVNRDMASWQGEIVEWQNGVAIGSFISGDCVKYFERLDDVRWEVSAGAARLGLDVGVVPSSQDAWYDGNIILTPRAGRPFAGIDHVSWAYDPSNGHVTITLLDANGDALGYPAEFSSIEQALGALDHACTACDMLDTFPPNVVTNVRLVSLSVGRRLTFDIDTPTSPPSIIIPGSVCLNGDQAGQVVWNNQVTHGVDSIIMASHFLAAGDNVAMRLIQGRPVLCAIIDHVLSTGQTTASVRLLVRLDMGVNPSVIRRYIDAFIVNGVEIHFNEPVEFVQSPVEGGTLALARLGVIATHLASILQQPGVVVRAFPFREKMTPDVLETWIETIDVNSGVARLTTLRFVFEEKTDELLRVDHSSAKPGSGTEAHVPLLTEVDGRGVVFIDPKDASVASWQGTQDDRGKRVKQVPFPGRGPMTFPEWLRNHDVTANNFLALSQARRLELFVAFLKGDVFTNHDLATGQPNPIGEGVRLLWNPTGCAHWNTPFAPNPNDAWSQAQGQTGAVWFV